MIITDKTLEQLSKEKKLEKLTTLYLHYYNIDSFDFSNKNFSTLEFLSVQNNNITNIDFIKNLPNLWYFDVRNNPLQNYESLNIKNVFGFLGLPVDKYCEKSLLQIKRLCVGILYVNLDENLKKYFLSNNPNILIYNNELIYEFDKTIKRDNMSLGVNPNFLNRKGTQELPSHNFSKIGSNSYFRKTTTKAEYLSFNNSNKFSEKIINLLKFFNDLIIDSGFNPLSLGNLNRGNSTDSNPLINSSKNVLSGNIDDSNPFINQPESPNAKCKIFKDENNKFFIRKNTNELFSEFEAEEILKKERSKLIYISRIYQSFLDLNKTANHLYNEHSKSVLESPINYNIDSSNNQSLVNKKNKNNNHYLKLDSLKVKDLKLQIAICTILGLYLIQVINKNMCYVLLKFICNKYKLTQHDTYCIISIKNILNLKTEILLGLYYNLIESLRNSNEFHLRTNSKTNHLLKNSFSTNNILKEEANKVLVDLSIHKHINTVPEANEKNTMENNIVTTDVNNKKDLNLNSDNWENDLNKKDSTENNPNFKWEEIIKVLDMENLIFNINKISQRTKSIYQMMEQNKNEDRKKFLLSNIIKPLDEIYDLFDEALIMVQYLSDYIKMNNFHDILLAEFTKDYRYFLETKDVFFQYLNNKSTKNLIYDSLTDRIFFKHKQNYLGNSIFFKLKEKKMEEKLAEHENNLSLKRYLHDISYENLKDTKKFYNTISNFKNAKLNSNKEIKSKASLDKINSNLIENKENNLKKFNDIFKSNEKKKQSKINFPQNFISKKHFFSQIKKNEQKKENMEKIQKEEEKNYDEIKKGYLKDKDVKPLISLINREKNNRNEVEKEQTVLVRNIRSRYSGTVKLLNNSEKKKNQNDANKVYSRSYDKITDILQESLSKDKNLNNSKVKNEYFQLTQENEQLNNNLSLYKSCNFLLTQIVNNESQNIKNAISENFSDNEYKLIPKKEFNKKHNYFFHNELYKVKMIKNVNKDHLYNYANKLEDEVSDYLKTMKLNIGPKPSSSINFYRRDNEVDFTNVNNRYSSNLNVGEVNKNSIKPFNKTTKDFYPTRTILKSSDNLNNFNQNAFTKYNNFRVFNSIINRNSGNKDQTNKSNQQEVYFSRPGSPEKFRKSSNNFLVNNVKIMTNEDVICLNNFRVLSPKLTNIEDSQTKNMKSISISIKSSRNFGDNVNLQNNNFSGDSPQNNNKFISNFSEVNSKDINNNRNNNPVNLFVESKFDNNRQKNNNNTKEFFRNSQNNFFNNPNKIILERKLLKSYNPRRIKNGIDFFAKQDKKENMDYGIFGHKEEQEVKKKIKITSIFPKKEIKEKIIDKNTFLDFRSNYKKLVHRWNENNAHSNNINNKSVKENDFFRVINKQKKQNLNIMSAKDINQLFSIRNKDEEIFNQIFAELDK